MNKTEELLEKLYNMVLELQEDNSIYHKQYILKNYPECKEVLGIIYNPLTNFYITGDRISDYLEEYEFSEYEKEHENISLMRLLKTLMNDLSIRGDKALNLCTSFIDNYFRYGDLIIAILNKDLECGISTKIINKVWPGLIPEFNVPKAKDYKENLCDFDKEEWYISRKLDGVRCLIFIEENTITAYSREGRQFFTLDKILNELDSKYKGKESVILDGELCIVDEKGNENFKAIVSEIRRKNHTIEDPLFIVFDMYTIKDFYNNPDTNCPYSLAYKVLKNHLKDLEYTTVLKSDIVSNEKEFKQYLENIPPHWEGYMLRKEGPTYFKRSNNLLKVKSFKDKEFVIVGIEESEKFIDNVNQLCIGSIKIHHKGTIVSVGSGLTDKQRLDWFKYPENILGKRVTIKYFEESEDKEGKPSLRFPTLKFVWNEGKI